MKNFLRFVVISLVTISGLLMVIVPSVTAQGSCPFAMNEIKIGDTVDGQVNEANPIVQYCFEGRIGDVVTIDLSRQSGSLDGFLELTNLDGNRVYITNDDRGLTTTDSQITFELPETTAYIINATRFNREDGRTQGQFELTITIGELVESADDIDERPDGCPIIYDSIRIGESFNGVIDDDDFLHYLCFVGSAGDEIVIDARADSGSRLDTFLVLTDLRFEEVYAESDDIRLGNSDSRIVFSLPEAGPYLITVSRYNLDEGTTEGDFTLQVQVNDGSFSEDDLLVDYEPHPYECNRPLLAQLNATQWREQNDPYDFRLNFGCEGLAAISILGEVFSVPYEFVGDDLNLIINHQVHVATVQSDGTLTLTNEKDEAFVFVDVGECSNRIEQDLIDGVWFLDENSTLFRLDFMCNGMALITIDAFTEAHGYSLDTHTDVLTINFDEPLVWTDLFILPGSVMSVEDEDDPFVFTNILTELEDTSDADI